MLSHIVTWVKHFFLPPITVSSPNDSIYHPLHPTLQDLIPHADSPIFVIRFMRDLGADLNINVTETEILFLLMTDENMLPLDGIIQEIDHISSGRIKRLLKNLHKKGLVYCLIMDYDDPYYGLSPLAQSTIRSYYKEEVN